MIWQLHCWWKEREKGGPNQQRTLNKLPPELWLMSTDWAYKSVPNVQERVCNVVYVPTELPFCIPPLVVGERIRTHRWVDWLLVDLFEVEAGEVDVDLEQVVAHVAAAVALKPEALHGNLLR